MLLKIIAGTVLQNGLIGFADQEFRVESHKFLILLGPQHMIFKIMHTILRKVTYF